MVILPSLLFLLYLLLSFFADYGLTTAFPITRKIPPPSFLQICDRTTRKTTTDRTLHQQQLQQESSLLDWTTTATATTTTSSFADATVILQVHTSHVDRLVQFLEEARHDDVSLRRHADKQENGMPTKIMSHRVNRRQTLLFLNNISHDAFLDWLEHVTFPLIGLVKVYEVNGGPQPQCRGDDDNVKDVLRQWTRQIQSILTAEEKEEEEKSQHDTLVSTPPITRFRLDVFPPSFKTTILQQLQNDNDGEFGLVSSKLSPTQYTHVLTAVQISFHNQEESVYLTGMSRRRPPPTNVNHESLNDEICRAFYKLKEAVVRHEYHHHALPIGPDKVAVDCGAAPGGWTQFLLDTAAHSAWSCRTIYSIDPARLHDSVLSTSNNKTNNHNNNRNIVQYWRLSIQDALPQLAVQLERTGNNTNGVDIWVSDMCLHDVGYQIDILLKAMECGVVQSGTFFVITLKCNKGHSKESFDAQVAEQRQRLAGLARDLQTFHLFSNRNGERTVVGYIQ